MAKMISLARRLAVGVARSLPNCVAYKNQVILLPAPEYLVRGFLFERTLGSGQAHVWELIVPLYNPIGRSPSLNHSQRISVGPTGYTVESAVKEDLARVCPEVVRVLQQKYVPALDAITTIDNWFRARPPQDSPRQRLNILLDYGVGYALCNDEQRAEGFLDRILGDSDDDEYSQSIKEIARARLTELKSGASRIRQAVQPIVAENVRRHFPVLVGV
jgi:hypothetical protein